MKNRAEIEKKVVDTLNILSTLKTPEPIPYLYERVMARMERLEAEKNSSRLAPVFSYGLSLAVIVLLFINVLTIRHFKLQNTGSSYPTVYNNEYSEELSGTIK